MTQIPVELLAMPLTELRERVELAERLALASRYVTPGAQYAGNSSAVQPQITESLQTGNPAASTANTAADTPKPATPRTRKATTKTEPAPAPTSNPSSSGPSAEELFAASEPTLDDLDASTGGDDMLADFSLDGPAEDDNTDWRAVLGDLAVAKQTKWKADNDGEALKRARALMAEFGVQRIGDLPDDKVKSFHDKFKDL